MKESKVAVICNSNNNDLVYLFEKKCKRLSGMATFYSNIKNSKRLSVSVSSFSKSPGLSFGVILDCFYSFFLLSSLLYRRVSVVIFDTAHISNIPIAILLKLFGIKNIFTVHDWNPHEGSQQKSVKIYNEFVDKYLADEYIVFSPANSNKKVYELTLSGYNHFGGEPSEDYYLFFGRIEPYKGLRHMKMIAKKLAELSGEEKIIIAGKGFDPALEELKSLENVEIINRFIEDDELARLIARSVSVLLPYDSATQSGVVIHAYAYDKPVVAFDVGSISSYVVSGKNGFVVEHEDHGEFVKKMLLTKNNNKELVEGVKDEFKNYDDNALVSQYSDLISGFYN
ncbi:glycosyltransferase [Ferrimonas futtsuensis]|uniref:glycosyltransferase n=1 Tax=Ferrimonas futtsuensis TaxID=364764 RepID=UPI0003FB8EA2|nr:glycosyltransferase [Ferrimonas futtsuensis]